MITTLLVGQAWANALPSIVWTLVHSVWQFAMLAAVLAVVLRLVSGYSPHLRYGLMSAALLMMALTPMITFCVVDSSPESIQQFAPNAPADVSVLAGRSPVDAQVIGSSSQQDLLPGAGRGSATSAGSTIEFVTPAFSAKLFSGFTSVTDRLVAKWMNLILLGWLIGMSVLSIRPLVGWRQTRTLRSLGRSCVSSRIVNIAGHVAGRLGVHRAVEVAQSSLVDVPTVIGFVKPLVLLPATAVSGLTTEQLEAVIAHELAHVRRHDSLVNLFQLAMETVFFFHPAVWWVSHLMRVEREECCDDIAVQMTGDRVGYVRLLLRLEEFRRPPTVARRSSLSRTPLGMSWRGGSLMGRVRRILLPASSDARAGTPVVAIVTLVAIGIVLLISQQNGGSWAQSSASPATIADQQQPDAQEIRNFMTRSIELQDWGRLPMLAKQLAQAGEYDEAIGLLSKAPLGKSREGKLTPKYYYQAICGICEIALQHGRLDFAQRVLNQLTDPAQQTAANKQFPPQVGEIRYAILEYYLAQGEIDNALDNLNSYPVAFRPSMVGRVARRMPGRGHGDQVESFRQRLTDPKLLNSCEHSLGNAYYFLHQPEKIWQLADRIAQARPDDLMAEIRARNTAMVYYGKMAPERFDQRLPAFRDRLTQLPAAEQTRYWKSLALSAAKSQRYELVAELSASVPLLLQSQRGAMDLSGTDHHPVLYAVTELHKQRQFARALAIIDDVKDGSVALAALARLANLSLGDDASDISAETYQEIVLRLALAYQAFSAEHDASTVRDVSSKLPEMMNIHLRRTANPPLSPDGVRYLDRDQLLITGAHYDALLDQGKVGEVVWHVETLMDAGDLRGARWIITKVAEAGDVEAVERLAAKFNQLHAAAIATDPKSIKSVHPVDLRSFWARLAQKAYSAGQRDRCFELFMQMDRNWRNPLEVSRVARAARQAGDLEFLRRMERSGSPQMRSAALRVLALHYVSVGEIDAARDAAGAFDREFRSEHDYWTIYRVITDEKNVKDPLRRFAAIEMVMDQLAVDSGEYATIAPQYAKLMRELHPGTPLPEDWLEKLDFDPSLRLKVEMEHAIGR